MKKSLLTLLLCAGLSNSLGASESKFGGFYVGANFGGGFGSSNVTLRTTGAVLPFTREADLAVKGVQGGLHMGYDHMLSSYFLMGLELHGDYSRQTGSIKHDNGPVNQFNVNLRKREAFGAALRVGLMMSQSSVIYLKVGAESAKWEKSFNSQDNIAYDLRSRDSTKKRQSGLVLGLGVETMLGKNWRLGLEWNYTKYSQMRDLSLSSVNPVFGIFTEEKTRDLVINNIKLRASYKF